MMTNTQTGTDGAALGRQTPTWVDELIVGREYPQRQVIGADGRLVAWDHAAAVALLRARGTWWLDLAAAQLELVRAGCADAVYDVRAALEQARLYAPAGA